MSLTERNGNNVKYLEKDEAYGLLVSNHDDDERLYKERLIGYIVVQGIIISLNSLIEKYNTSYIGEDKIKKYLDKFTDNLEDLIYTCETILRCVERDDSIHNLDDSLLFMFISAYHDVEYVRDRGFDNECINHFNNISRQLSLQLEALLDREGGLDSEGISEYIDEYSRLLLNEVSDSQKVNKGIKKSSAF